MKITKIIPLLLLLVFCVVLSGCAPGSGNSTSDNPAGFFTGIWHGWIAPFSLIWGLLIDSDIRIYEVNNSGWWYDLGFYMAIIGGFGGIALIRKTRKKKR
jgi:hypothetical protein